MKNAVLVLRAGLFVVVGASLAVLVPAPARAFDRGALERVGASSARHHRVIVQVTQNDPAVMIMALRNAQNLINAYKDRGQSVRVEFVAYGPGLHMVRADTSPVKERITAFVRDNSNAIFSGCQNTVRSQSSEENKEVKLLPEARLVPSGIARVVELQEQGWSYVRP